MFKLFFLLASLFSTHVFADYTPVAPCNSKQLKNLEKSIQDWKKDEGYSNIYYIKNLDNQVLGYYSADANYDQDGIHAEVCDYMYQDGLTVSNEWYYWGEDEKSTHPSKWSKNKNIQISQDEGFAYFKIITTNKNGNIKAQFKVVGWMDDADDEIIVRLSTVVFEKKLN